MFLRSNIPGSARGKVTVEVSGPVFRWLIINTVTFRLKEEKIFRLAKDNFPGEHCT